MILTKVIDLPIWIVIVVLSLLTLTIICLILSLIEQQKTRRKSSSDKIIISENKAHLADALLVAEEATKTQNEFTSKISHEIRTPLNAIIGFLTLAKNKSNDSKKVEDCIEKATYASKHLLHLINDVLDISAINNNKLVLNIEDVNINSLIKDAKMFFQPQIDSKSISFLINSGIEEGKIFKGDPLRISQILINIISNALKFTDDKGMITITVNEKNIDKKKSYINITIKDTGCGMSKEFLTRLGKPFEQQDSNISQKYGGTGLGLSIVKNLIHIMNGKLIVTSEINRGSEFMIELPLDVSYNRNTQFDVKNFKTIKALVVDHNNSTLDYLVNLLECFNTSSKCINIEDFEGVIKLINKKDYDLFLIDLDTSNSIDLIKKIREICGKDRVIVGMTANKRNELDVDFRESDINSLIRKPVFQNSIYSMLLTLFNDKGVGDKIKKTYYGKNVLLVEDNDLNAEIAKELLKSYRFTVDIAKNGKEAVEMYKKSKIHKYNIVLMDIMMPIMDGYQATKEIRSSNRNDSNLPIIAMTANAYAKDVAEVLAKGMNDHIAKPIDPEIMVNTIAKYL